MDSAAFCGKHTTVSLTYAFVAFNIAWRRPLRVISETYRQGQYFLSCFWMSNYHPKVLQ